MCAFQSALFSSLQKGGAREELVALCVPGVGAVPFSRGGLRSEPRALIILAPTARLKRAALYKGQGAF